MKGPHFLRAAARTLPAWVVPVAALVMSVSLVLLCVPSLEGA